MFGDFGPFWARLGPHLGPALGTATLARSTLAAETRAFRVPTLFVVPKTIPDSVVTFFSILAPLLLWGPPGAVQG